MCLVRGCTSGIALAMSIGIAMGMLSGCVVTPPQAISWGASAVSYIATGKSLSDHALSVAVGQDCALLRVAEGEPICEFRRPEPRSHTVRAAAPAAFTESGVDPRPQEGRVRPANGADRLVSFLVVASFPNASQAMAYRSATVSDRLRVLPYYAHGVSHYRIVAGPIRMGDIHRTRDELVRSGLTDAWLLTVCSETLLPPPCTADAVPEETRRRPFTQASATVPGRHAAL